MKIAFAVFLFLHAFAHAVGVLSLNGVGPEDDAAGPPALLFTGLNRGDPALRLLSIFWLMALAGFVAAGIGVIQGAEWAVPVTAAAAALSMVLCIMWYRDAPAGIAANVLVILALVIPPVSERVLP